MSSNTERNTRDDGFIPAMLIAAPAARFDGARTMDCTPGVLDTAGDLGDRLLEAVVSKRWLLRGAGRTLTVTAEGERQLQRWAHLFPMAATQAAAVSRL